MRRHGFEPSGRTFHTSAKLNAFEQIASTKFACRGCRRGPGEVWPHPVGSGCDFVFAKLRPDMPRDKPFDLLLGASSISFLHMLHKILIEQVVHCRGLDESTPFGDGISRVFAIVYFIQDLPCNLAGALGRDRAMLANGKPARASLGVPILHHIRAHTARLHSQAEAGHLVIPKDPIFARRPDALHEPLRRFLASLGCRGQAASRAIIAT